MPDREQLEALFLSHLGTIERIIGATCSRRGLRGDDAADCASWVKSRLIEDDYAILRKFRGESSITTYLTVVIAMLVRDYRVRRWGRWRPSAAAKRMGAVATRLEKLVYRQGYRLDEAAELLRSRGETDLSDREIVTAFKQLPTRAPLRPVDVGPEPLAAAQAAGGAEDVVESEAATADRRAVERAVAQALERLAPQDRLVLRMRFWAGSTVADIARGLGVPQKPLYRQIERALTQLRSELETAGVSRDRVRDLLDGLEL
jgi:RNA polymerase sigma factor for flagellar operon FliA